MVTIYTCFLDPDLMQNEHAWNMRWTFVRTASELHIVSIAVGLSCGAAYTAAGKLHQFLSKKQTL